MNTMHVWHDTDPVSPNYHSHGGLVVVAADLEGARSAALEALASALREWREPEGTLPDWQERDPDETFPVDHEPVVWTFPDAGCC